MRDTIERVQDQRTGKAAPDMASAIDEDGASWRGFSGTTARCPEPPRRGRPRLLWERAL